MGDTTYTLVLFTTTAVAYALLLVLLLLSRRANSTRTMLVAACAATAGSAVAAAAGWANVLGPSGAVVELASSGSWCAFVLHLLRKQMPRDFGSFTLVSGCGIVIALSILGFALLEPAPRPDGSVSLASTGELISRLCLAIYGILLTENLYRNITREFRWHINLLCIALGVLFAYAIVLYADALLFRRVSPLLWMGRAIAMTIAMPLFAVAAARNRNWAIDIHVSRGVVFHTATLIGSGIFLLALALTGEVLRAVGPGWGDLAAVTLVVAGLAFVGVVLTSGSARSRLRRGLAENFFSHRYDYRREWLRSIEILSDSANHAAVQTRVIKAVAEIADSPAGVLWVRDLNGGAFHWAGSWNRPAIAAAEPANTPFVDLFAEGDWIVELDRSRVSPDWLDEIADAWLAVPLGQKGRLLGFVILVRPRAPLELDREAFDLLRIVARQAAIHVAEQQYAQALAEAQELRDYGKRFAFIAHDIKNVASQLAMIVQNARLHEGDPEFHRDVLITVRVALDGMKKLLDAVRPRQEPSPDGFIVPIDIINEAVATIRRSRDFTIDVEHDGRTAAVAMDAGAFRSVMMHLCENAIEASEGKVQVNVHHAPQRVEIEIADNGGGMSAEFIRDRLFQPFGSTKGNGFGIGAYQARELVRSAGGDLLVSSRPGNGTIIRILLPCIGPRSEEISLARGLEPAR
jgi:putative PEP-CTERM system histidine kinase